MILFLQKYSYFLAVLIINLYLCSYLSTKLSARIEKKKGNVQTRFGGLGYPALKFASYLSKESHISIYDLFLFIFSLSMWMVVPITQNLILLDINSSFFISTLLYIATVSFFVFSLQSGHGFAFINSLKKAMTVISFYIPIFINFLAVIIISTATNLKEIVNLQYDYWNIAYQPLGFVLVFISIIVQAKLFGVTSSSLLIDNTTTMDKGFSAFIKRLAKFMIIFYLIIMLIIFYLGGWLDLYFIGGEIFLVIKFYLLFITLIIFKKALPSLDNFKYLIDINWKFLVPASIFNFIFTIIFLIYRNIFNLI